MEERELNENSCRLPALRPRSNGAHPLSRLWNATGTGKAACALGYDERNCATSTIIPAKSTETSDADLS